MSFPFNSRLFWDVDLNQIDVNQYHDFIIVRIFERGDVEDIRQCRRFYNNSKIKSALLNTKHFLQNRLHLAAAIIDEPIEKFKCFTIQQSTPQHFPY
ncbi:MAG: hypothetical protein KF732_04530 [Flavobacteriales bacterium]|nr:hypothetical protein [Flavobacteriales bacterium]MBX2959202.1 hypothetical protein [Flavobacteriales bacterium]HRN41510.1 hypothetical protein [Vicingus sp.]HRP61364.1 hypothetical protein [Vicingus sp.]